MLGISMDESPIGHQEIEKMNPKSNEPAKLKLNTETVRNLTQAEETAKVVAKTVTYPYCCWTF